MPGANDPSDPEPGSDSFLDRPAEEPDIDDMLSEFEVLEDSVDTEDEREQVRETMRMATAVATRGAFGRVIRGYDRADVAEAVLGAVLFGIPMLVEGGTLEIGRFLADHPLYHAGTFLGGIAVVVSVLYVAEIQEVRVHRPLFGVVPRRLAGVLVISYTMAAVLMTAWGRLDTLDTHAQALASVTVAFVPMAIGAALGDILPGS